MRLALQMRCPAVASGEAERKNFSCCRYSLGYGKSERPTACDTSVAAACVLVRSESEALTILKLSAFQNRFSRAEFGGRSQKKSVNESIGCPCARW
jgi:hypothetical protein